MSNPYFRFKQFTVRQEHCAMKVCTDACLFGAWTAHLLAMEPEQPRRLLDIGTGTGLLALMLAQTLGDTIIDAVEIDAGAAEQARANFQDSPWAERLMPLRADIRCLPAETLYDCIVSNPPFFAADLKSPDRKRNLALHSEELSMEELMRVSESRLATNGRMAILIPYHRKTECIGYAAKQGLYPLWIADVRQTEKHGCFRTMLWLSRKQAIPTEETILIRETGTYTEKFSALLKDYYLFL